MVSHRWPQMLSPSVQSSSPLSSSLAWSASTSVLGTETILRANSFNRSKGVRPSSNSLSCFPMIPLPAKLPRFAGIPSSGIGVGCGKALVGKATADDLRQGHHEPPSIVHLTRVEAPRLLIEVTEQVERLHAHVRAFDRPLHKAPEVFEPVRVDAALRVRL